MMSSTVPQSHTAKAANRQRRMHRATAWAFMGLGCVLLAANLGLLSEPAGQVVRLSWPAILVAAGLWLILAQPAEPETGPPAFAVERGEARAGELVAVTGTADLQVQAFAGASQLAVGQFPSPRGPQVTVGDNSTRVVLSQRLAAPLVPGRCWGVALAKALPWALDLSSSLGDFNLDLHDLAVASVRLRSTLGHVDLTVPAAGQIEMDLRLALGDVTIRVPEAMAIRLKVRMGRLATVRIDTRRFVELAPGEWASPLFAVSAERCTLALDMGAGELKLS